MLKFGMVGRRLTTRRSNWDRNQLGNCPARHFSWYTRDRTTWQLLVCVFKALYGESQLPLELQPVTLRRQQ